MDHKGDIIITSDMHIKLVGMVKNWKTTWPKIFQIERGNQETGNRKRLRKEMRMKMTMTMNKITKFSLEGKKKEPDMTPINLKGYHYLSVLCEVH